MNSRRIRILPAAVALAGVYFVAGKLALKLAFLNANASPVWPPAGIALAALLLIGYRVWPAIFLAAFFVNFTTAGNFATSLSIATGNTLETFCAAWMLNRFAGGTRAFDRAQDVFKFALIVALACLISPTIGVTGLAFAGFADWVNYGAIWTTWWLGDVTGDLIVAPLIILWVVMPRGRWNTRRDFEVAVLFVLLFCLAQLAFGGWFASNLKNYPISFVCGPIVMWTAFRFSQRETATGVFILTSIAIWGTLHGFGRFAMGTENYSLVVLQTWAMSLSITMLALAAGMAERRRAELLITKQKSVVEAANRTKDNFLAMLSHELRTPLTPVIAALETLKNEPLDSSSSKTALEMMRRNIELESQLIDDLLDLTRVSEGRLQLQFEPLDAHRAISNVAEICAAEIAAKKLQLTLNLRAVDHFTRADPAKFQQIIWNLLKNAIKFTGENGQLEISSSNKSPESLTVAVTDSGIGIEPEIMGRIFNRFEQGDRSFQRRFGGLGLGLTISKSLAEAHAGTLAAESDGPGRGARFLFTIKTIPAPKPETMLPVATPATRRALRILLVDDHHDTSVALERLLTRRGHTVASAHDIGSALAAAQGAQFDLLVSDVGLPDGSGLELMKILGERSGIRGVAISGFGMNGDMEKSIQAGFSQHLVKPVNLERLEAAIETAMSVSD